MKKFLLTLFVGFVCSINFGHCLTHIDTEGGYLFYYGGYFQGQRDILDYYGISSNDGFGCLFVSEADVCTLYDGTTTYNLGSNVAICTNSDTVVLNCTSTVGYYYTTFLREDLIKTFFPDYTSQQCQLEYNLIPINEVNENYCVTNGLCPSNGTCGDLSGVNWSSLYINDIQHISAPLIDITIPEEFNRNYTGNDEVFELSVEGYNVDTEYIAGIINTQNTKPTQSDLNDIINKVLPLFIPGLVIILFIYFVFRFIKKIF